MSKIWIVVADEAKARIFAAEKPVDPIVEIQTMTSSEANLLEQDLVTDKPGRGVSGSGQNKHAFEENSVHKEQYAVQFAKEISDYLDESLRTKAFGKLHLIAAPRFLGLLRKELSKNVENVVSLELDKDLTMMEPEEIREHLPKYL
ncbi:host attachment protein [Cocleimonas sp. KMM 6892]|uniref:host attachment protein n=1 Tax=unclassified Cocleimonas TaxID=2639732 RepID=UPI002DBB6245|nr:MULTISPECIES: host attachment protein [unclassified Cocleimonas]MEB8431036.1 host attachment protein [Cocleimonas sp. KMM 6892]MEC4714192.1 host attachment protein [Cocleimonas sp. KMM 6895]MEC4743523.1 host attachment protein [Cocleimonas sp. KMM 6896]